MTPASCPVTPDYIALWVIVLVLAVIALVIGGIAMVRALDRFFIALGAPPEATLKGRKRR